MTRTLVHALNAPFLAGILALGLVVQSTLFHSWPLRYFQPDVVLLMVIWVALRRSFHTGGILTLIVAHLAEIHSAVPQGLFLVAYMAIFLGVRSLSQYLITPSVNAYAGLALVCSLAWRLMVFTLMMLLGSGAGTWKVTLISLCLGSATEGLISIWVFRALHRVDQRTFRSTRRDRLEESMDFRIDDVDFQQDFF